MSESEAPKRKRTFRKFSYRGVDLDQLLELSTDSVSRPPPAWLRPQKPSASGERVAHPVPDCVTCAADEPRRRRGAIESIASALNAGGDGRGGRVWRTPRPERRGPDGRLAIHEGLGNRRLTRLCCVSYPGVSPWPPHLHPPSHIATLLSAAGLPPVPAA